MGPRNQSTIRCVGCGHVFNVGGASDGSLVVGDRPVSGGAVPDGNSMGAEGVVMAVVAKGPEKLPGVRDEARAFTCPQCGRLN